MPAERRTGAAGGLPSVLLGLPVLLFGLDRAFPPDLTRYHTLSPQLLDHDGHLLHVGITPGGYWRLKATPGTVAPAYLSLLLANEDRRFRWHPGVDPLALARAAWQLLTHGHIVSGGSTIAMQVARLLEPHPHDLRGKLHDILRALQLEAHYGRRAVLTMYLTLAPMGGNIEGVRAASLIYFRREPADLTAAQAAMLVALPQHPTRLRPDRHAARAWAAAQRKLRRVMPDARIAAAPVRRHALPHLAWHVAMHLRHRGTVRTTLDAGLQRALERLARSERHWLGGDADLAALVVRNRDHAILGYLGSADFFGPGGMVDATRAVRSPGSTLKPFIYGLAIDDGLILPGTLIDDRTLRIGTYAPHNFDHRLHGEVTAARALQQSYNLPAVALLARVGPARFAATLQAAGITLHWPPGSDGPGLPLALGGVGITLQDLVTLYTGLADGGRVTPLRLQPDRPVAAGTPVMTAAAARQVTAILRGTPMPDGVAPARPRGIAYKTGTSYGFRDAWAVGCSGAYTVGVWVGQVAGTPRPGAYGLNTAAPILFRVFDLLPAEPAPVDVAAAPPRRVAPGLRHFGAPDAPAERTAPRIIFPPADARLELSPHDPIALEASGGTPPYTWLVNGLPLPAVPLGLTPSWRPDGIGFARLSVVDRHGHSASEMVHLVSP